MDNFVIVEGRALKRAMKIIMAVVERRNTIPVLSCAKITLSKDALTIAATDLDIEITTAVDVVDGAGEWSICIAAATLAAIARVAGIANVRIAPRKDDDAKITISDIASYDIPWVGKPEDFPHLHDSIARGELLEGFSNGMFAAMVQKVAPFISTEETRYYLNGVCWHTDSNGSRMVATDGHRLARCHYSTEPAPAAKRIIPRKMCAILVNHFAGEDVKVFAPPPSNTPFLDIVMPGVTIRTKLIDGTYPDYERVIPSDETLVFDFTMRPDEIVNAIDKAAAIGGRNGSRAIKLEPIEGRVAISYKSADFGQSVVRTSSEWPTCGQNKRPAAPIGVNCRYLREMIGRCSGDVTMRTIDHGSPMVVLDADKTMTRVLMPMRV